MPPSCNTEYIALQISTCVHYATTGVANYERFLSDVGYQSVYNYSCNKHDLLSCVYFVFFFCHTKWEPYITLRNSRNVLRDTVIPPSTRG